MQRWLKLAALVLLAAWLPATLHCRIETAGLTEPHHDECTGENDRARTDSGCKDDVCPSVEETLIKESPDTLVLAAPATCGCHLCAIVAVCACDGCVEPALSPARHAPPPELRVAWQFVARAAPSVRAPSLNTARA